MRRSTRRARWAAILAAVLTLALAGGAATAAGAPAPEATADAASAPARSAATNGTLTYIAGHNLWIARGDGSGRRQLTRNGTAAKPYVSPSQSSGGIIAVGHGDEIVRMRQDGTVLNRINPTPLTSTTSHPLDGPVQDVEISPNGSLIAYTLAAYTCPIGTPCMARTASSVTHADRFTRNFGQTVLRQSSWIGNGRLIQSGGYNYHAMLVDLGQEPVHWFDDRQASADDTDLGDLALSPNGRSLVAVRGWGANTHIAWYQVTGNATSGGRPPVPDVLCYTSGDARTTSPTWSPDSTTMAWSSTQGIWIKVDPAPLRCGTPQPRLLIPGGSQPHWSAAALAPVKAGANGKLNNTRPPAISGKPRVGRTLKATPGTWSATPMQVRYQWLRGGKPIAKATKRTYRLRQPDRGKRIAVRVTVQRGNATAKSTSRATRKVRR